MMRVVADTNIFVSALQFGGLPEKFLDSAFADSFQLLISAQILDELDRILRLRFYRTAKDLDYIQRRLLTVAIVIIPSVKLDAVPKDPDDNIILECAVEGSADFIISGDRHLLQLGSYQSIPILKVRDFMDRIKR